MSQRRRVGAENPYLGSMDLLPYGASTLPFDNAVESVLYVEAYFPEFPFVPQDFEGRR